jgi:hypothetical protein
MAIGDFNPVQSPDAGQTINTILGIQAKKQALQTGQYTQQSAQASAQNDSRIADEQSRIAAYVSNPANKGKKAADMADDINSVAPTTGQAYLANRVGLEQKETELKAAQSKLSEDNKGAAASVIGSFVGSKFKNADLANQMDIATKANPQLAPVLSHYKDLLLSGQIPDTDGNTPNPQRDALVNQATTSLGGKSPLTGGLTDTGPTLNQTTTNANTGAVTIGAPAATKGLSPTQQPGYIASATGAGARATGTASSDIERGNQVSALVQPSKAAIPLTQQIDDLANQINSGKLAASISKAAAAVGMSADTYARQLLEKDLGQVKAMAIQSAGSDSRASTILSGYPTAESDPQTIHAAMDLTRGTFRQNVARGELLNKVKSKDSSLQGFQHADDTLTGSQDPLMHEFKALNTKEARAAFYKRHFSTMQEAQEFRNKVAGMSHDISQ